ncbi:CBS domain-containing protein [Natranaerofaba carboxydovora]|uniref:CBS domain-containing protein n=1 Tax=Natranaerofaba carboxydovora TaxID=2742683 RepID=UPI001F12DAF9|nr:CBS domain-containing protein [Natranaerofaba carboxydovora]UMZ74865.1 Arabinose 5-phosphate isomerase KdsD [Natranaerofaba carboxydovora]
MQVKDIMDDENFGTIIYKAGMNEVAEEMLRTGFSSVLIIDEKNKLTGIISGYDLRKEIAKEETEKDQETTAADIMTPREKLLTLNPESYITEAVELFSENRINQIPVVKDEYPVGLLNIRPTLDYYQKKEKKARLRVEELEEFADIIDNLHEALIVFDKDKNLRMVNKAARELNLKDDDKLGNINNLLDSVPRLKPIVEEVLALGETKKMIEVPEINGKNYVSNCVPLKEDDGEIQGVLQTFSDVTQLKKLQIELTKANNELDKAFALTLPNYKVENKLRSTPEYKDVFDSKTGNITITDKIADGGYRHVINALKVAADLHEKGVMNLVGIDKDVLVRAIIFHDIGKTQPNLEKGTVVNPCKIFEDGKNHAARSAEFAKNFYDQEEDLVSLIYYHHHKEEELPASFPGHLLPSFRLFKIIDGCSAGITRRDAVVSFDVQGTKVTIHEQNTHPMFNLTKTIDLFSGSWWSQALKNKD